MSWIKMVKLCISVIIQVIKTTKQHILYLNMLHVKEQEEPKIKKEIMKTERWIIPNQHNIKLNSHFYKTCNFPPPPLQLQNNILV